MWNPLKDRKFAGGFMAATVLCALAFVPIAYKAKSIGDELVTEADGNQVALNSCSSRLADLNSQWTLIMDKTAAAAPAAQFLNGLVAITPGQALAAYTQPVTRWAIPVKIRPYVYGAANGAQYFYVNNQTGMTMGPYVPGDADQSQIAIK